MTDEAANVAESGRSRELAVQEKQQVPGEEAVPGQYFVPATDVYETDKGLTLVMEMPGVGRDNLDVSLEEGVLRVEGRLDLSRYAGHERVCTRAQHRPLRALLLALRQDRSGQHQRDAGRRSPYPVPAQEPGRAAPAHRDNLTTASPMSAATAQLRSPRGLRCGRRPQRFSGLRSINYSPRRVRSVGGRRSRCAPLRPKPCPLRQDRFQRTRATFPAPRLAMPTTKPPLPVS